MPSEPYIQRARQTRAANADSLADVLHAAEIPSLDLANASIEDWHALAKENGVAIGKPAQARLVRDTINALKLRETRGMVQ